MFVKDFKELQERKTTIRFDKVVNVYEWNQNTEKFNQVEKDLQAEIDKNIGMDLKSMIARNIMPKDERKSVYGDATILKDVNLAKLYDMSNLDIVVENDEPETKKDFENGDTEPKKENPTPEEVNNG